MIIPTWMKWFFGIAFIAAFYFYILSVSKVLTDLRTRIEILENK